jgi:hypothetical protein
MTLPPPEFWQALANIGALGLSLIAVWAFATGRVRVGFLVDRAMKELKEERDDWQAIAQAATPELKRLNDLLDTMVKQWLGTIRPPRSR